MYSPGVSLRARRAWFRSGSPEEAWMSAARARAETYPKVPSGVLHGQHHPCHTRRPLPGPGPADPRGERPLEGLRPLGGDLLGGGGRGSGLLRPQPGGHLPGEGLRGEDPHPAQQQESAKAAPRRHTQGQKDPPDPGGERAFIVARTSFWGPRSGAAGVVVGGWFRWDRRRVDPCNVGSRPVLAGSPAFSRGELQ